MATRLRLAHSDVNVECVVVRLTIRALLSQLHLPPLLYSFCIFLQRPGICTELLAYPCRLLDASWRCRVARYRPLSQEHLLKSSGRAARYRHETSQPQSEIIFLFCGPELLQAHLELERMSEVQALPPHMLQASMQWGQGSNQAVLRMAQHCLTAPHASAAGAHVPSTQACDMCFFLKTILASYHRSEKPTCECVVSMEGGVLLEGTQNGFSDGLDVEFRGTIFVSCSLGSCMTFWLERAPGEGGRGAAS